MEFFGELLKAFVSTPLPAAVVVLLLSVAWLVRYVIQREREFSAEKDVLREAFAAQLKAERDARLADVTQIVPLTHKLVTVVEFATSMRGA
jgi:hypothetical protein